MSWWEESQGEGGNEEEEGEAIDDYKTPSDRIIFLIDARESMLQRNSRGETHLKNCITMALSVLKSKITADDKSAVGLTFFGTRESQEEDARNLYTFFPIGPPTAQRIRDLQELIETQDLREFHATIGSQNSKKITCAPLKQALWTCSQSFASKDYKNSDYKRLWIFTNDDDPYSGAAKARDTCLTVGKDCAQAGIEISLWHLNSDCVCVGDAGGGSANIYAKNDGGGKGKNTGKEFNPDIFYRQLLLGKGAGGGGGGRKEKEREGGEGGEGEQEEEAEDEEELLSERMLGGGCEGFDPAIAHVRRKEFKKRAMTSTLFCLSGNDPDALADAGKTAHACSTDSKPGSSAAAVAVKLFKTVKITKRPSPTWLFARTNEPTIRVTRYVNTTTGEAVAVDAVEKEREKSGGVGGGRGQKREKIVSYLEVGSTTKGAQVTPEEMPRKVPISAEEMKKMSVMGNIPGVGIRLLYFLPRAMLAEDLNLSEPYFVYPDNSTVTGSADLCEALLRDMAGKDLVALVRFNLSDGARPSLAALFPQLEQVDEDGCQTLPPGFQLVVLPYTEDLRVDLSYAPAAALTTPITTTITTATKAADQTNSFADSNSAEMGEIGADLEDLVQGRAAREQILSLMYNVVFPLPASPLSRGSRSSSSGCADSVVDGVLVKAEPTGRESENEGEDEGLGAEMRQYIEYTKIESPAMQRYYSVLQAVALGEEEPEWVQEKHDQMKPENMHKFMTFLPNNSGLGDVDRVKLQRLRLLRFAAAAAAAAVSGSEAKMWGGDGGEVGEVREGEEEVLTVEKAALRLKAMIGLSDALLSDAPKTAGTKRTSASTSSGRGSGRGRGRGGRGRGDEGEGGEPAAKIARTSSKAAKTTTTTTTARATGGRGRGRGRGAGRGGEGGALFNDAL